MSKYGVFSGPNTGQCGPEKTPYLDTFHAVLFSLISFGFFSGGGGVVVFVGFFSLVSIFQFLDLQSNGG